MRFYFFIISIILSGQLFAQDTISGVILDSITHSPLPYTHIILKNTNQGAITNADGTFKMICSESDTLVFSFISYQRKELPCQYFIENRICVLTPSINELESVSVYASFDYLVEMTVKARNRCLKKAPFESKTYFSLESNAFGMPVELLEVYFNAEIHPYGIKKLTMKNGRIGMSKLDNHFYVSLSTTKVVSGYNLYNDTDNKLPRNPLQLTKGKIKKNYNVTLVSFENDIYQIAFKPKFDSDYFFTSVIWVDNKDQRIVKVELSKNNIKRHPLLEIDPSHKLDSLNFFIAYTYANDVTQTLQKIEVKYDLLYNNNIKVRKINTTGVFLFYDRDNIFNLPYYSLKSAAISDYDKIVFQPYNAKFWQHNEILLPSKKVFEYRNFFKKHGMLLNYNKLSEINNMFREKIVPWSARRLFYNEINFSEQVLEDVNSNYYFRSTKTIPFLYELSYQIYLDKNTFSDGTAYVSSTLINLDQSYYFGHLNKYTTAFINVYFDLVEIEKRKMMEILMQNEWNDNQVDSIYKLTHVKLNKKIITYLKRSYFGENKAEMDTYINDVKQEIGVDNSNLVIDDQFLNYEDDNTFIDMYSCGNTFFKAEKQQQALDVLLKAYNLGDSHPWLLYNLGLNFLVLNDLMNACEFFMESKRMGQKLDPYILKRCSEMKAPSLKEN